MVAKQTRCHVSDQRNSSTGRFAGVVGYEEFSRPSSAGRCGDSTADECRVEVRLVTQPEDDLLYGCVEFSPM
jgi:hypothetical protein